MTETLDSIVSEAPPPPNMRRPEWLEDLLSYGRKQRSAFKNKRTWHKRQSLLKLLVSRFFVQSNAQQTKQSLFRACIVLGLFLMCNRKAHSMTSMVLHLLVSCSPTARRTTLKHKPVRVSRPSTKADLRKIIQNQETLYVMSVNLASEIAKLAQNRKGTRTNRIVDQEPDKVFEFVHLSDDSASASEAEDDVEDEVEDQVEYEGGEGLDDDEAGDEDQDDDDDEDEVEEYRRGSKSQRLEPSSSSL